MNEESIPVEEELQDEAKKQKQAWQEEIQVAGDEVLGKVQELLHEAAVRKITVKDASGKTLLSLPLWSGVAGALVMGPWTALVLVGAWLGNFSILIEYAEPDVKATAKTAVAEVKAEQAAKDLRGVKGIGPKTAEKLAAAGIKTMDDLARATVAEVMEAAGVNPETAQGWISQAESVL